jgi:hypothetical protein
MVATEHLVEELMLQIHIQFPALIRVASNEQVCTMYLLRN